ncbi:MAG: class I SAM-dependent rRNA methyltransferase [Planctomycetaceae bacterium]|nr:class I SAM-dependent rRNA methyltransferase [Planctomycetaceae bacterium]
MTERHEISSLPVVRLKYADYAPFIFRAMVGFVDSRTKDGDLVAVMDKNGRPFGFGFYNSRSQIALRMVSFGPEPVGESIVPQRIARAVALRRDVLRLDATTEAYRLVHSEGDGLSGLVADRFGRYVAIELFSKAMFRRLEPIQAAIAAACPGVEEFVVRADDEICRLEGFRLPPPPEGRITTITENGVKFEVDLSGGHKTGFFCDQRDNRLALTAFTAGKSVLDCCCYSAGFSCYAAAPGKAAAVTAVDIDEAALATAKRNMKHNRLKFDLKQSDAFEFLRLAQRDKRRWDVVVLDPSKFVPSREEMERGLRKYRDLNSLAAAVVAPGGMLLTCSCSGLVSLDQFIEVVARASHMAKRGVQIFRTSGAGADHPVMADAPQSAYLKAIWARVE